MTIITYQYAVRTVEWVTSGVVIELRGPACTQRNTKRRCIMAGIAILLCRDVPRRCAKSDTIIVAGFARGRYFLVVIIDMAGLTLEADMRAFSRYAGGFVIVLRLLVIGSGRMQVRRTEHERRQQQQGCEDGSS